MFEREAEDKIENKMAENVVCKGKAQGEIKFRTKLDRKSEKMYDAELETWISFLGHEIIRATKEEKGKYPTAKLEHEKRIQTDWKQRNNGIRVTCVADAEFVQIKGFETQGFETQCRNRYSGTDAPENKNP